MTADALKSNARPYGGDVWRVVEQQWKAATSKLVGSHEKQALLESILDRFKPPPIEGLEYLHYLLSTPFRYAPDPLGSRFRRAGQPEAAFYAAERPETAIAEAAFHTLLFFMESPGTILPADPHQKTGFAVPVQTAAAIDLTAPPFNADAQRWTHPIDYAPCQDLADEARASGIEIIRSRSARDPHGGLCVTLLTPDAFRSTVPSHMQTWRILLREDAVEAWCELPERHLVFKLEDWNADPRVRRHRKERTAKT